MHWKALAPDWLWTCVSSLLPWRTRETFWLWWVQNIRSSFQVFSSKKRWWEGMKPFSWPGFWQLLHVTGNTQRPPAPTSCIPAIGPALVPGGLSTWTKMVLFPLDSLHCMKGERSLLDRQNEIIETRKFKYEAVGKNEFCHWRECGSLISS